MSDRLKVHISSFSYKKGLPHAPPQHGGGYVFDCRSIPNPGRQERFKSKTGRDPGVKMFLNKTPAAKKFLKLVTALIDLSVKNYLERGFSDLIICFGCTGGQHRSVYFAERLAKHLSRLKRVQVKLIHRDMPRFKSKS